MVRVRFCVFAIVVLLSPSVFAQTDVDGNWRVEFAVPTGEIAVNMTINQSGSRLSGRIQT